MSNSNLIMLKGLITAVYYKSTRHVVAIYRLKHAAVLKKVRIFYRCVAKVCTQTLLRYMAILMSN